MHPDALLADRYRLRRRLASGGMGEVWLAADSVLGREVAVKVLSVGSDADQAAVQRFALEARTLAALQHPNIVTIFDSGTPTGTAFIVMELLPGPTLAQLIADRGRLPEAEAVLLAAQVASGLDAAHRAGVIHRDIKPANLMFSSSGMLKIVDFGIARLSQTATIGLTATNAVIGSASYLSPEQAVGATVDERSDLYSLGCVLVAMVTGRPPFTADHPMAILHQQVNDEPPRLRELLPEASPALEALVQRILNKRPDARPATAAEVEAELTAIASATAATGLGATTTLVETAALPVATLLQPAPTRLLATAQMSELAQTAPLTLPERPVEKRPRPRWVIAAGILTAVLLIALASISLLNRTGSATSGPLPHTSPTTSTPKGTPSSPATTPRPTVTTRPTTPLEAVRAAVAGVVADGQMDPRRAEEFGHLLDELGSKPKHGKKKGNKPVENLTDFLTGLVRNGELTADGYRRIQAALSQL
ncbi:MAG TPA: protein kinase [Propionicimonas sp.]